MNGFSEVLKFEFMGKCLKTTVKKAKSHNLGINQYEEKI